MDKHHSSQERHSGPSDDKPDEQALQTPLLDQVHHTF
jgi:hypothetical protein